MNTESHSCAEKMCRKCLKTLPISYFYENKAYVGGRIHTCKSCRSEANKRNRIKSKDAYNATRNAWRRKNRHKLTHHQKIRQALSSGLTKNLRRSKCYVVKSEKTMELLGCTLEFFMAYIEFQFWPGMSWDNYGHSKDGSLGWHIDHIIPCSKFDLSNPEDRKKCFHYLNLQPLWAVDNMSKGDNLNHKILYYEWTISA